MVTTMIARRSQFHQEILGNYVREGNFNLQNSVTGLTQLGGSAGGLSHPDAQRQAYARIYELVQAQSATLAYIDTFMVLAVLSGVMFFLAFILRPNHPGEGSDLAVG